LRLAQRWRSALLLAHGHRVVEQAEQEAELLAEA